MGSLLEISGTEVAYGRRHVLHECSLNVGEGEFVTLVGHNGAGKTTLLRTVMGLVRPLAGTIRFAGRPIDRERTAARALAGLTFVPDTSRGAVFSQLSVRENLALAEEATRRAEGDSVSDDVLRDLFPPVFERMGRAVAQLSGGQRQMVAIAMALKRRPKLLLLDEPSVGLAPKVVEEVMASVKRINVELGVGALVVEQNIRISLEVSDRIAVLKGGRVIRDLHPSEIEDIHQLWEFF